LSRATATAAGSVAVALAVLALKSVAWWLTGSVALFADALESVVNVAAALAALGAVRYAAMPADANHPYGHHKAEYFSAVLEGALILAAAFVILNETWVAVAERQVATITWPALGIALVATAVNAIWCRHLFARAAALRSPALRADARHLLADVVTSLGVVAGIGLAAATGIWWLDPLMAGLTALNIVGSGARLMRESVGGLMDEAVSPTLLAQIRAVIGREAEGALEAHDIRSRQAGRSTFIEFHLVVPGGMTVEAAHEITDRIEAALKAELGEAVITIHVEPEAKAKHSGVVVL